MTGGKGLLPDGAVVKGEESQSSRGASSACAVYAQEREGE